MLKLTRKQLVSKLQSAIQFFDTDVLVDLHNDIYVEKCVLIKDTKESIDEEYKEKINTYAEI